MTSRPDTTTPADPMTAPDSTTASESMLRKVRGLLDKAENTEFEAEQDALFAKAAELMARYRITEAMIAGAKPKVDRGEIIEHTVQWGRASTCGPVALLCAWPRTRAAGPDRTGGTVGWGDLRLRVRRPPREVLYTSLLVQATSAMRRAKRRAGRSGLVPTFVPVRLRHRVNERWSSERSVADEVGAEIAGQTSASVALVLVDRRQDVDDEVFRRVGRVATLGRAKAVTRDGYTDGRDAGDRADLHTSRGVTAGRAAIEPGS